MTAGLGRGRGYVGPMPRQLTRWLTLVLLAATGACGGGTDGADTVDNAETSSDQLTKDEFIEKGDAICGELEVGTSLVEFPQSQEEFAAYLTGIRGPTEAARESWELLEPPSEGEQVHQAMLDALTERLEALNGGITAAESGDTVTAEDLRAEADRAGAEADAPAQAYGFTECGSGDQGAAEEEPADPSMIEEEQPAEG